MVSLNPTCGISNLSIQDNDEVGFVILDRNPSLTDEKDLPDYLKSRHTYATELFAPLIPPVYGKCDENGRISAVQNSLSKDFLESVFRRPAEVVLNCMASERIYDYFGEIFANYFTADKTWGDTDRISHSILLALGFEKDENSPSRYIFEDAALEIEEKTDGSYKPGGLWFITRNIDGEVLAHGEMNMTADVVMDTFGRVTGLFPGFDPGEHYILDAFQSLSVMFFLKEVYESVKVYVMENFLNNLNFANLEFVWDGMINEIEKSKKTGNLSFEKSLAIFNQAKGILGETSFPFEIIETLKMYKNNYDFLEIIILSVVMASVNKVFMPTILSYDEYENKAPGILSNVSSIIEALRK